MNQSILIALLFASLAVVISAFPELSDDEQVNEMVKRKSAYMRFGRSDPEMQKRKSAYMRFGKRSSDGEFADLYDAADFEPAMEKRKSAYMRFGKRSSPIFEDNMMEKRKSAYMRFGKRSQPVLEMIPVDLDEPSFEMIKRKPASIRFG